MKRRGFAPLVIILVVALVGAAGTGAYVMEKKAVELRTKTKEVRKKDSQVRSSPTNRAMTPTPTGVRATPTSEPVGEDPAVMYGPRDVMDSIVAFIDSRELIKIKPFLAPTVNMTHYATECCEPRDPDYAISFIRGRLDAGGYPWTFSETHPTIIAIKELPEFRDLLVGLSGRGAVLTFKINSSLKVESIVYYNTSFEIIPD